MFCRWEIAYKEFLIPQLSKLSYKPGARLYTIYTNVICMFLGFRQIEEPLLLSIYISLKYI